MKIIIAITILLFSVTQYEVAVADQYCSRTDTMFEMVTADADTRSWEVFNEFYKSAQENDKATITSFYSEADGSRADV